MINEQDCINNGPGIWVPKRFLDDDACDFSRLQIVYCKAGHHDLILGMPKFRSHFRTSRQESSHIAEAFFVLLLINMLQTVTWFLRMQRFGSHFLLISREGCSDRRFSLFWYLSQNRKPWLDFSACKGLGGTFLITSRAFFLTCRREGSRKLKGWNVDFVIYFSSHKILDPQNHNSKQTTNNKKYHNELTKNDHLFFISIDTTYISKTEAKTHDVIILDYDHTFIVLKRYHPFVGVRGRHD